MPASQAGMAVDRQRKWLSIDPAEELSDDPGDKEAIEVSVDVSALLPGKYTASITIDGRKAGNDPQLVPVDLILSKALPDGASRVSVSRDSTTDVSTSDGRVRLRIPAAALSRDDERNVQVEVRSLDLSTVPKPPEDAVFIQAVEVHTVVDGEVTALYYEQPVGLEFLLNSEDLALAEGDGGRFRVFWANEASGEWDVTPSEFETDGDTRGRLTILLDHFSTYAAAIVSPGPESAAQQTAPTATGTPKPAPSPSTPQVDAQEVGATSAAIPSTPTPLVVAQATSPTPARYPSLLPLLFIVPTAPVVAAAPEIKPPLVAPLDLLTGAEPGGGIGTTTIVILAVVGLPSLAAVSACCNQSTSEDGGRDRRNVTKRAIVSVLKTLRT